MEREQAAEWLYTADVIRQKTRKAVRAPWIPLAVFGVISLLASPLYRFQPVTRASVGGASLTFRDIQPVGLVTWFGGGTLLRDRLAVSLFWLVALPLGYVLSVLFYRRRASRLGVAGSARTYAAVGVALLAFQVAISAVGRLHYGGMFNRGLTPLVTVALGLFVLAWAERSPTLGLFAATFLGLILLAPFSGIEHVFFFDRETGLAPAISMILPGTVLIAAACGFWLAGRSRL
jgi:hypothetical protein